MREGISSTRLASALALPSTSRAAICLHRTGMASTKADSPSLSWSPIHCSSVSRASRAACVVSSVRLTAAARRRSSAFGSSSGGGSWGCWIASRSGGSPADRTVTAAAPAAFGLRRASHSPTHSGGVPGVKGARCSAHRYSNPMTCLHGNLREGHVHLLPLSRASTMTR